MTNFSFINLDILFQVAINEYPNLVEDAQNDLKNFKTDYCDILGKLDAAEQKYKDLAEKKLNIKQTKVEEWFKFRHTILYAKGWYEVSREIDGFGISSRMHDLIAVFIADKLAFFRLVDKLKELEPNEPFPKERIAIRLLSVISGYTWKDASLERAQEDQVTNSNFRLSAFRKITSTLNVKNDNNAILKAMYHAEIEALLGLLLIWCNRQDGIDLGSPDPEVLPVMTKS